MRQKAKVETYDAPAGGWGSLKAVASILTQEEVAILGSEILLKQNKPDGFMCVSCSWAKPAKPASVRVLRERRQGDGLGDHQQDGHAGVLREAHADRIANLVGSPAGGAGAPDDSDALRSRRATNIVPVDWDEAFREIGAELNALDPRSVVMYTSGRASLEASYMYQLFGRMYGTNNFPDSSNMCHETTSVALPEVIGVPVGTVLLEDFERTDCIFFFGHNTTTNAPRMLHPLQEAAQRGVPIITFNPLRERGLERFTNPQSPVQMIAGGTRISSQYHQVRIGGDAAAIVGICKG